MKFAITSRYSGKAIYECELDASLEKKDRAIQLGAAVKLAVEARANLADAYLARANLADANLSGANLAGAYLEDTSLAGAYLEDTSLAGANLEDTNLARANLAGANLAGAYLEDTSLAGANLAGAYLSGANLAGANLAGANLARANLAGVKNGELAAAMTIIAPPEGEIIGWKKCLDGVLVKLLVPAASQRSNATSRKCRAEYVKVLDVEGATEAISSFDGKTKYRVGETVRCHEWDGNRWNECSGGIHFFLTREEAEAWEV